MGKVDQETAPVLFVDANFHYAYMWAELPRFIQLIKTNIRITWKRRRPLRKINFETSMSARPWKSQKAPVQVFKGRKYISVCQAYWSSACEGPFCSGLRIRLASPSPSACEWRIFNYGQSPRTEAGHIRARYVSGPAGCSDYAMIMT